jgi:hypothetical protein
VTDGEKIPFPRFQQYLRAGFVPHPVDIQTNQLMFRFAKWYFDLVKNTITVGALLALGGKTHNETINLIGWLSFGVLGSYIFLNITSWHFELFHPWCHSKFASVAGRVLWTIIATGIIFGAQFLLLRAINVIVDSSMK